MSVLDSIIKWAEKDLPDWQSDAVRRLLTQDDLSSKDKEDLLCMLKKKHNLVDESNSNITPRPLRRGDISGAPAVCAKKMILKAVKDLRNVNAIPDGSELLLGHEGLSVMYGENASGKSGYARVLKRACKARDTREQILPNIYNASIVGQAKAVFKISVNNGQDQELNWEDGEDSSGELANISVFDSKCTRVFIDEKNEIAYRPYGSHVFSGLVTLLQELRSQLDNEKPKLEVLHYEDVPPNTRAGKFINGLSYKTLTEDIENITSWEPQKEKEIGDLKTKIAKAESGDPVKQAQRIRNLKVRINELKNKINQIDLVLSKENEERLIKQIREVKSAEQALTIISKESLAKEPLPGAGGVVWQRLYEAAKEYSVRIAYPDKEFPYTEEGSRCVLCMELLSDDSKDRLKRFKEFMEQTVKKELESAIQRLKESFGKLQDLDFALCDTYKDAIAEVQNRNEETFHQIERYLVAMEVRAKDMIKAAGEREVVIFSESKKSSADNIEKIANVLEAEAREIEKSGDPAHLVNIKFEKQELNAKKLLSQRKEKILTYVEQLKSARKYDACISETWHAGITTKGRKIISSALTPELIRALQDELNALGAIRPKLNLKSSGDYGETMHKMELLEAKRPCERITEVLSEGEQNVVGIAGFLAELKVSEHSCPIVLDDPICSLDHKYRKKVAERLAREATDRQVIIFTHDIAFLLDLQHKAAELGNVKFKAQTVRCDNAPGRCSEGLPWHSMSVKNRLSHLDEVMSDIRKLYGTDLTEYNKKAGNLYALLRETWEAAIEQVLLHRTVMRHSNEIHTLELRYVNVTDDDYRTVYWGMHKCSEWLHDKAKALDVNRPDPGEIQNDINELRDFLKDVNIRSGVLQAKRKASLEPDEPEIG